MGVEKPDWLPVDWKVSVKVRSDGKKDKYYIDPSTGSKFSSRPDVIRHLTNPSNGFKLNSRPDVLRIPNEGKANKLNKIIIEKTVAENLPPGWIKEIRTKRKKGGKARRDLYYIDPVSGRYFRSMPAVFRYLDSNDSRKTKKPDDKARLSSEVKGRRSANDKQYKHLAGIIKSGKKHASSSKRAEKKNIDVMKDNHFEESEENDSLAFGLSDKLQVLVNQVKQHVRETRKFKKLGENRVDTIIKADQRLKSGLKDAGSKKEDLPVLKQRDGEDDSVTGVLSYKSPQVNEKEQHQGGRRRSMRLLENKQEVNAIKNQSSQSGPEVTGKKIVNMPECGSLVLRETVSNLVEEEQWLGNEVDGCKRKNSKRKCFASNLSCRTSKKLALVEVDPSEEVKISNETQADEPEAKMSNIIGKLGRSDEPRADNPGKSGGVHGSSEQRKCSAGNLACRTSKRLALMEVDPSEAVKTNIAAQAGGPKIIGKPRRSDEPSGDNPRNSGGLHGSSFSSEQEHARSLNDGQEKPLSNGNLSSPEEHKEVPDHRKEDNKQERNPDSSLKDLLMDPCIEFAVKTLTGAIPIEDLGKVCGNPVSSLASPNQTSVSSSALPSGDIWADPCFDFAVKMLTDEIPVTGRSNFHISFQQPVISNNLALSRFSSDNLHPSNRLLVKDNIFHQSGVENCDGASLLHGVQGRNGSFM